MYETGLAQLYLRCTNFYISGHSRKRNVFRCDLLGEREG